MSPEWLQFRLNEVTSLVNEIVEATHSEGKLVSAAVFPYPTRAHDSLSGLAYLENRYCMPDELSVVLFGKP